ncbi:PREDICTED: glutamine-rich protein 2-like isoform X2 [Polistes dominula]|uniref:Glutamine-rich protein 2-like isoform X2 n=1 Tax=Polistes dominula TaxID=743375 RepID=A0ABM1IPL8_POLDO|nr:PREDICTED: glutamine-rich protein 2-like isoform X2 [Polistes dominula]
MAATTASDVEEEKTRQETKKNNWSTVAVSLPQLLDLALGTPEVGAINLNILHNFLHVLLQQMNLRTTRVEFRGDDAKRIKNVIASSKSGPNMHLYENIIVNGSNQIKQRFRSTDQFAVNIDVIKQDENIVGKSASAPVSPRKDEQQKTVDSSDDKMKDFNQSISIDLENNMDSRVSVEPIVNGLTPTASAFKKLEENVKRLEKQFEVLQELSTNSELIERLKGNLKDPLTDVWNIININKRLDAAEQGISKLTSMIQEVIKNEKNIKSVAHHMTQTTKRTDKKIIDTNVEDVIITDTHKPVPESKEKEDERTASKSDVEDEITDIKDNFIQICLERCQDLDTTLDNEIYKLHVEISLLKEHQEQIDTELKQLSTSIPHLDNKDIPHMIEKMQRFLNVHLEERLQKIETNNSLIMDTMKSTNQLTQDSEVNDLQNMILKIEEIQEDIGKLNETANYLMNDTSIRNESLNRMLEQLKYLQTMKADKELVESSLADKADTDTLNRKVSHDKFDTACNDLTQEIQQAMEQMNQQNSVMVGHVTELQKEIEKKVNKIEVEPLKTSVSKQFSSLREKVEKMIKEKQEKEAAATKKKLSGVQCLSCNKDTTMRMEDIRRYESPFIPPRRSIRPYLTYELDQIRKQQKPWSNFKNMKKYEAVMAEFMKSKYTDVNKPSNEQSTSDDGCNRYCGGSHTITTPQQRVKQPVSYLNENLVDLMKSYRKKQSQKFTPYTRKLPEECKLNRSQSFPSKDFCINEPSCSSKDVSPSPEDITCPMKDGSYMDYPLLEKLAANKEKKHRNNSKCLSIRKNNFQWNGFEKEKGKINGMRREYIKLIKCANERNFISK